VFSKWNVFSVPYIECVLYMRSLAQILESLYLECVLYIKCVLCTERALYMHSLAQILESKRPSILTT
jgi:hypothetical protein